MRIWPGRSERGAILPFVLIAMALLAVLSLAGAETARFGLHAARTQSAGAAALFAADEGIDAFVRSTGAADTLALDVPPGRATVTWTPLVRLDDGSALVDVRAEGVAWPGTGRALRRTLARVVRIDSTGRRQAVAGSWREDLP